MRMQIGCLSEIFAAYIALYPTYVGYPHRCASANISAWPSLVQKPQLRKQILINDNGSRSNDNRSGSNNNGLRSDNSGSNSNHYGSGSNNNRTRYNENESGSKDTKVENQIFALFSLSSVSWAVTENFARFSECMLLLPEAHCHQSCSPPESELFL